MPDPAPGTGPADRIDRPVGLSPRFDAALRLAAVAYRDQVRRGSGVPYVSHPYAVALILDRAGFPEDVVIAGLLHDVVEDTDVPLAAIAAEFGPAVAATVADCSEQKLDAAGQTRPWADRKRDHRAAMAGAPAASRAVALADKLHNLASIESDVAAGRPVWDQFHASRAEVVASYRAMIDICDDEDPRLRSLADACRALLARVATVES